MNPNPEMGRELLVPDLKEKTVIVLWRDDRSFAVTAWVDVISTNIVIFKMVEIGAFLILARELGGMLVDDTGKRIRVFEYLGKV